MEKINKIIQILIKTGKSKEFQKFFVIGISTFILDFTLLQIFIKIFNLGDDHTKQTIANIGSSLVAIAVNYVLQRSWAFQSKNKNVAKESGKFFLVQGINLVSFQLVLFSLVNYLLTPGISKVIVTGVQIAFSFVMYKFFVFKTKEATEETIEETVASGMV